MASQPQPIISHPPRTPAMEQPLPNPVSVVGSHYLAPYPIDLIVTRKLLTIREGNFSIADINGNVVFKVQGKLFSIHDHRTLLDASDKPIVSFRQKVFTAHRRWNAFRGGSTDTKDLLFTVKKSSLLQFSTKLQVFLAGNTSEDVCDFRIEGAFNESACTVLAGESNTIIAQMHRKHSLKSEFLGKDTFAVTVYPNVDYAFITALIVILEEINSDRNASD